MGTSRLLLGVVLLCGCASPAFAQAALHLETGAARVRYGDTLDVTAGTISAAASALTPASSLSGLLAGSATGRSSWTMFAAAQGSAFTRARRTLRGELHGNASLSTYASGSGSSQLQTGLRVHASRRLSGAWIGAGGGAVKDPVGWRATYAAEAGAWMQARRTIVQAVVIPVRIAGGVRYTDVEATARWSSNRAELVATTGRRTGIGGYAESDGAWASVNAIAWLWRTAGITTGIGSYPSDPGQDLPAARYITLGVRVAPASARRSAAVLSADVLALPAPVAEPAMTVAGPANRRTITFRTASAQRVEIMGDFTDWTPMGMRPARTPGSWTIELPISSGVHQVNVRLNGGSWLVPAGLTAIPDEFGGSVGVLLVP